jgi:hypothetical protein
MTPNEWPWRTAASRCAFHRDLLAADPLVLRPGQADRRVVLRRRRLQAFAETLELQQAAGRRPGAGDRPGAAGLGTTDGRPDVIDVRRDVAHQSAVDYFSP